MSGLPKCDCGAFMRWIVMRDGQRIPLNPTPSTDRGTVWIDEQGRGVFLNVEQVASAREKGAELWVRHHSTCPMVGRHRVPRAQTTLDLFGGDAA